MLNKNLTYMHYIFEAQSLVVVDDEDFLTSLVSNTKRDRNEE